MHMYPSTFADYPNASPGEREIFRQLKRSESGKDWIVLHSLDLLTHVSKTQSEADFVVLIPGVGVLVLEVKSVRTVSYSEQGWKLGNKIEQRGPFKQANEAMRSIMSYLDTLELDYSDVPFVYAVWFTHVSKAGLPSSIAWQPEQVLTSEDLKSDVAEVLRKTTENLVEQLRRRRPPIVAPTKKLKEISEILLPRFTAHQAPAERQRDINDFLSSALAEQLDMVKLITNLRAVLLQGLAGTGKTFIAIHAAQLAHEREERVLFICYNSMLAEFLKEKLKNYPLVRVSSLHALMLDASGLEVPVDVSDEWWTTTLPSAAMNNSDEFSRLNTFDTLVIDEAQDIGSSDNLIFLDQLLQGGLSEAKVLICGDFKHQGIFFPGANTVANYSEVIPGLQILTPLLTNCRNTEMLGEFLGELLNLNPSYESYRRNDSGSDIVREVLSDESQITQSLSRILEGLLRKFTPEQVVLLSAQKKRLSEVLERLKLKVTEIKYPKTNHVRWGSVHEFKGLEALAVVLVEFDTHNNVLVETFYVGATRSVYDFAFIMTEDKLQKLLELGDQNA